MNRESPRDCPDVEAIAAFIDGELIGAARAEMLEHLDRCATCYRVFVEASEFKEEERGAGEVADFPSPRPGSPAAPARARWRWAAAAAVILAATLLWGPKLGLFTGADDLTAELRVERLVDRAGADGEAFDRRAGWSYARAEGFAAGLGAGQRSFRLGVRLVDLEVALRSGDRDRALDLLVEIGDLAGSFELAEHLQATYEEMETRLQSGEATARLLSIGSDAARWSADVALADHFALGKWTEAGRLAAEAGRPELFREKAMRAFPTHASRLDVTPEAAAKLGEIARKLDADLGPGDLEDLARDFTTLAVLAANR